MRNRGLWGRFQHRPRHHEVCGASGDIRLAIEEFQDCILQTGLIGLPLRGEHFTWHNYSMDGRSLWKRLDRMLVNDSWLGRWPTTLYESLTPRTSDHSPLLLRGVPQTGPVPDFLEISQQLLQLDKHNELLLHLEHCCRLVYLKATKLEQVMLQQRAKMQWMKGGDQCSRVLFRKVTSRRAAKRIFQIFDATRQTFTDPKGVSAAFVCFYQQLLGGNWTRRALDLTYLRPWARHIISADEAQTLIRPFTREEVKADLFDIEEDRAPGPDGYSSGFFKVAWPIIGDEVTRAVLDFFATGRLLKQVNATLLTLIPILWWILDRSLANVFVPGQSIGDNILLAQELFSGYNQLRLPPCCALKVDLRKAYDTVEWDFILATLKLFGFPVVFIAWIEECITSAHFSVCLNGDIHGYFTGARGLRQGDPSHLTYLY
ncbi:UNVERIFIED_CONTAM: hypothetical protein Slati_3096700 [Sesamum latifolium]|uniref:Reverse transcriptase domain-containing protein n=1 Tax=Sesamum latifolium TaxID=2727402 RepID=A0AAW2UVW0_9LAMI